MAFAQHVQVGLVPRGQSISLRCSRRVATRVATRPVAMSSLLQDVRDYGRLVASLSGRIVVSTLALVLSPLVFSIDRIETRKARALAESAHPGEELDRAVFITGASAGIGRALALAFATHPNRKTAAIYLTGRSFDRLNETASLCRSANQDIRTECIVLDVTNAEKTKQAIYESHAKELAVGRATGLDVVVANAGVVATTTVSKGLDAAREIFDINLTGTANTVVPAAEIFTRGESGAVGEKKSSGSIVIMSSASAYLCGAPMFSSYAASKVGQRSYGEALAAGLEKSGVDVLVVCPSFIDTNMTKGTGLKTIPAEVLAEQMLAAIDERGVGVLDVPGGSATMGLIYAASHLPLPFRRSIARLSVSQFFKQSAKKFARNAN